MRYVLSTIFHENIVNLKILLYKTNQHQKWNNFHFEHFPQNSKLTLDRAHCACCALDEQLTAFLMLSASSRACRVLGHPERGRRVEHRQGLILSFGESVQNTICSIFDAD